MILTLTPNPCVDKTIFVESLEPGKSYRDAPYTTIAGGKGVNVSRAVLNLGGTTRAVAILGGHTGALVCEMMEHDGIDTAPCWVESPTRTITTILEAPTLRQTVLFEPGSAVTEPEAEELQTTYLEQLPDARIAAFNGVVPDTRLESLYAELISEAKSRGVFTILDSHGPAFARGLEATPDLIKPNIREAEEALGRRFATRADQWKAVDAFHETGIPNVVLSLGADGVFASNGEERLHIQPPTIDTVNPVGSGDALVAGIAIGISEDLAWRETVSLGVAAGTANAQTWDICRFTKADVAEIQKAVNISAT